MDDRSIGYASWATRPARRWHETRTFASDRVPMDLLARKRAQGVRVSVGVPALDEAATIGGVCATLARMADDGLVDEVVVLDGGSRDGTPEIARAAGADVTSVAEVLPWIEPVAGKGESLWRSLACLRGDVVVWVDGDIRNFDERFVCRLLAPLLLDEDIAFVKGFYDRPIESAGALHPTGGGRVTELLARPLLAAVFPELGGFRQPLAGEYAGRREVLRRVPFFTGYSVEVGLLIDLLGLVGLDGLAQADLGARVHRNRPLRDLSPMAFAIGRAIARRAEQWNRLRLMRAPAVSMLVPYGTELSERIVTEIERPPMETVERGALARH